MAHLIGTEKRASVYTLERKEKKGHGTDFYPFRSEKGPKAFMDPFWNGVGKIGKIDPSRSTFYRSRLTFFFRSYKRALRYYVNRFAHGSNGQKKIGAHRFYFAYVFILKHYFKNRSM